MTSDKRDFEDFNAFPGLVKNNIYVYPTLEQKDSKGRFRRWNIYVAVIKRTEKRITAINWKQEELNELPILDEYFTSNELPANTIAVSWSEAGLAKGKITKTIPTYYLTGAFEGHSNQRNEFQQALINTRSLYLDKQAKGGSSKDNKNGAHAGNKLYFPMLATEYKKSQKYIKYPIAVQPKLDGTRCIAYLAEKDGGFESVVMYSRRKKIFAQMDNIKKSLYNCLNELYDVENKQSIYLDGELYRHGKRLQDIVGQARKEKKESETEDYNEYHLYDCFYPNELDTNFETRHKQLDILFEAMNMASKAYVKQVPTQHAADIKEVNAAYKSYLTLGYEGAILRNLAGAYKAHATSMGTVTRSHNLIKMKPKMTDEYKCIGYTQGKKGKDVGAVLWVCETKKGVQFNVTPKDMTYEERYDKYKECVGSFDKLYKNKLLTIEYEGLSTDDVPLRAKALVFRTYE